MFRYLPSADSDFAPVVDDITNLVTDLSVFFTVAIVGTMIYFAVKYRKKGEHDHETPHIEGSVFLEVCWTLIPTLVCVVIAFYGYYGYKLMREVPKDALEINVVGQKWNWSFSYPNGKQTIEEFAVPVGKPIKLILTSKDVLHSFFVPGMRTKTDAVPGRYTYQWFRPIKTGPQQVYCTEYCGERHSAMLAKMHVLSEADYERWLNVKEITSDNPIERGRNLYNKKLICKTCHSLNGTAGVGPSFLKLYGKKGELADGKPYEADDNYIKESILYPSNKVVKGFAAGVMPAFEGQIKDEEIGDLIAFIKTLDGSAPVAVAAEESAAAKSPEETKLDALKTKVSAVNACSACHNITGAPGGVGPTWKGLYGRKGKFQDGTEYEATDEYIKESILEPQKHIVEGYVGAMPAYAGQISDDEIKQIVEFLKEIK
jgi:cytochrome c oxidase subunit II